eukprot:15463173-Alexandrium_andersonii.AAC.1
MDFQSARLGPSRPWLAEACEAWPGPLAHGHGPLPGPVARAMAAMGHGICWLPGEQVPALLRLAAGLKPAAT